MPRFLGENILRIDFNIITLMFKNDFREKIDGYSKALKINIKLWHMLAFKIIEIILLIGVETTFIKTIIPQEIVNKSPFIFVMLYFLIKTGEIFLIKDDITKSLSLDRLKGIKLKRTRIIRILWAEKIIMILFNQIVIKALFLSVLIYISGFNWGFFLFLMELEFDLLVLFFSLIKKEKRKKFFRKLINYIVKATIYFLIGYYITYICVNIGLQIREHIESIQEIENIKISDLNWSFLYFKGLFRFINSLKANITIENLIVCLIVILILNLLSVYIISRMSKFNEMIRWKNKELKPAFNFSYLAKKESNDVIYNLYIRMISRIKISDFLTIILITHDAFLYLGSIVACSGLVNNRYILYCVIVVFSFSLIISIINNLFQEYKSFFSNDIDYDNYNWIKMSGYKFIDIFSCKYKIICRTLLRPFILTLISTFVIGLTINISGIKVIFVILIVELYVFLNISYIQIFGFYPFVERLSNLTLNQREELLDLVINKWIQIPKKWLITPIVFIIIFACFFPFLEGNKWILIFWLYLLYSIIFLGIIRLILENNIKKKLEKNYDN